MIVGPIFALLALIGVFAVFTWLLQFLMWLVRMTRTSERTRRRGRHPIDVLEEKLVNGEIDSAEFEEKRKLLLIDNAR